jgi:hypothetical protein
MTKYRPPRRNEEGLVQATALNYIRYQWPHVSPYITKIDNEQPTGNPRTIQHKKQEGLNPGASDIIIPYPLGGYHGFVMEVKKDGWKLLPSNLEHTFRQLKYLERLRGVGYYACLGVGVDMCLMHVKQYFTME